MPSRNDQIDFAIARIPEVGAKLGTFVSRAGVQATVNVSGSTVVLPFVGTSLPPAGHPVQLELRAGQMVVVGPSQPLPGVGRIVATGSPRATVSAWGPDGPSSTYMLPYQSSYTPAINDDVELSWTGDTGIIQGKISTTLTPTPPPVIESDVRQTFRPDPFTAIDSVSFNGSYSTRDVWASNSYIGAAFYGLKLKDTIPDTAVIKAASIYLNSRQIQGAAPVFGVHTSPTRPGGAVTFTTTATLGGTSGWVTIPLEWIDYLKANDGGIGTNHGGFNIFRGTQADALAFALDITWEA